MACPYPTSNSTLWKRRWKWRWKDKELREDVDVDVEGEVDVEEEAQGAPSGVAPSTDLRQVQICAEYSGSRFSGSRFSSGFSSSSRFSLVIGTTPDLMEVEAEGQGAPESP